TEKGMWRGMRRGMRRGMQRGEQRGEQRGMQRGEQLLLRRLLIRRFGPLPSWVEQRLETADCAQLEDWGERLLDTGSLETFFGKKQH
ncbi:MAG: DUF4351 domain-containing protein, partial [Gammaproteobacteria bacterium]|nr:DUF4351 domain-containing protein [Gammaproteobacteria bacterium]